MPCSTLETLKKSTNISLRSVSLPKPEIDFMNRQLNPVLLVVLCVGAFWFSLAPYEDNDASTGSSRLGTVNTEPVSLVTQDANQDAGNGTQGNPPPNGGPSNNGAPGNAGGQDDSPTANQSDEEGAENSGETGASNGEGEVSAVDEPAVEIDYYPLIVLAIGILIVLGLIIGFKVNAFVALITAAIIVSLLADGPIEAKISRVASSFGSSAGGIGIVIALAAIIGKCMLDSGAADRIVRFFLGLFGEKRSASALMGSGFVLAIPVFFDTVFYLLVPLARSLHRKTGRDYLKYILAIGAGGAITHTLVPPTPGPLLMAGNLGVDVGVMILIGALVALPSAIAGLVFASIAQRIMKTPMRSIGNQPDPEPLSDDQLPSLWLSLAPVLLPVILISMKTITTTVADSQHQARISVEDVGDWRGFRTALTTQADSDSATPGGLILNHPVFTDELDGLIRSSENLTDEQKQQVVDGLNELLLDKGFYNEDAFLGIKINDIAKAKLGGNLERMKPVDVERMNRALLESAHPAPLLAAHEWDTRERKLANICSLLGDANLALLISTVIALATLLIQRGLSLKELGGVVEVALMSGGVIILITSAGGAFGAMLKAADVGPAIQTLFSASDTGLEGGLGMLVLGFLIAAVLKIAQGSSTVAMIVGSGMMAAIVGDQSLGFHPVYLATAIGSGSLIGSWMNDSGFWIFAKMGGLTEGEALKSWTVMLVLLGGVGMAMTILLSYVLPMV